MRKGRLADLASVSIGEFFQRIVDYFEALTNLVVYLVLWLWYSILELPAISLVYGILLLVASSIAFNFWKTLTGEDGEDASRQAGGSSP